MSPRTCTSCPFPHVTTDWYRIEYAHPRHGEYECAEAHERRIPIEVRDFGTGKPPAAVGVVGRPRKQPDLMAAIGRC
jgi:hypothetical protein